MHVYRLWAVVPHHKVQWWGHNLEFLSQPFWTHLICFQRAYKLGTKYSGFFSLLCVGIWKSRIHYITYIIFLIDVFIAEVYPCTKYPHTKFRNMFQFSFCQLSNILSCIKIFLIILKALKVSNFCHHCLCTHSKLVSA